MSTSADRPAGEIIEEAVDAESRDRLRKLERVLDGAKRMVVLTHDNPDPDAFASAYALLKVAHQVSGATARIGFGGIVGRAENRTMVRELALPVTPARDLHFDEFDIIALVDTQPGTGNNSLPADRDVGIVIDHHPHRQETERARFADVRPDVGATCTIMTEYLKAAGIPMEGDLATALFYGLQSETQDLGREATQKDMAASLALYPHTDRELLSRIRYPRVPKAYFKSLHRSLERTRTRGPVVVSMLGNLDYPDLVAELADLYLRLEGIEWSFCIGVFDNDLLVSVRTTRRDAAAGEILRDVVGREGSAGGHGMTAGARIPVGDLAAEDVRLRSEEVVNRFIKTLGVEDEVGGGLLH